MLGDLVSDFDFRLPEELIAQTPPQVRGSSRMLCADRATGGLREDVFQSLPSLLRAGDVLVLNDSRVIPARLYATRLGTTTQEKSPAPSGKIEVLLTQQVEPGTWTALVRPGKKVPVGETLVFDDVLRAEVIAAGEFGERTLRFGVTDDFLDRLDRIGHMPLPPYIHRADDGGDKARYQTVYAGEAGSAAAPTAGLHFTPEVLQQLAANGVIVERVTLHVGLGTFQPVRVERLDEIHLHTEHYTLPQRTADAINSALAEGRRVIAAGTTTTRTLEHCAAIGRMEGHSGATNIFLRPGSEFRVISGLLTNFHLPQSTLLMLVSGFLGSRELALAAYDHAVRERYRFFSYGDCMLIL